MDKERERLKCVKTLNKCTVSLNKFSENIKKCKRESKALKQQNNNITILIAKLKELKATKAVSCRLTQFLQEFTPTFRFRTFACLSSTWSDD